MPDAEEAPEQNAAVRSYLNATITPVLLKGLIEMEKEECARMPRSTNSGNASPLFDVRAQPLFCTCPMCRRRERPVVWLAQWIQDYVEGGN